MNYLREITLFHDYKLYNSLPTSCIALWHAIIGVANKTGWKKEFTVSNLVMQSLTGLSRKGLDDARNTLMQKGLIKYKKGTSNQAGKYELISLSATYYTQEVAQEVTQGDTQEVHGACHSTATLYKQDINKTKLNNKDRVGTTPELERVINKWNELNLQTVKSINANTKRHNLLNSRIKEHGLEEVLDTIEKINQSSFLKGQNERGWTITFDWFIKPNNFIKVQEGNYDDKNNSSNGVSNNARNAITDWLNDDDMGV